MSDLLNVNVDKFQDRRKASVPQPILDDREIALGLLHQTGSDSLPETMRAHMHPKLATQRGVEA